MNKKQERMFWLAAMIGSWLIALWVVWSMLVEHNASIIHVIGMSLICYFTTTCYISTYDYE